MIMSQHSPKRGATPGEVDRVALTVPDHDAAVTFCVAALGAEVLYTRSRQTPETTDATDCVIHAVSRLRVGPGLQLEIYELAGIHREIAADFGDWESSSFSLMSSDRDRAIVRFRAAGGRMLDPAQGLRAHGMPGHGMRQRIGQIRYGRCPWGTIVEFIDCSASHLAASLGAGRVARGL